MSRLHYLIRLPGCDFETTKKNHIQKHFSGTGKPTSTDLSMHSACIVSRDALYF